VDAVDSDDLLSPEEQENAGLKSSFEKMDYSSPSKDLDDLVKGEQDLAQAMNGDLKGFKEEQLFGMSSSWLTKVMAILTDALWQCEL